MSNKPASLSALLVRKGEAAPSSAQALPSLASPVESSTLAAALPSRPVNQILEASPLPSPAPVIVAPVIEEPAVAPVPVLAPLTPPAIEAPAPAPTAVPATVIQLPPATELISEMMVAKQKAMTVKLDYQRFVMIKQLGLKLNNTSQDIFTAALDDYFRKQGML